MNIPLPRKMLPLLLPMLPMSCTTKPANSDALRAFAPVQSVLETNCAHCHGDNRLSTMPPITDSHALSRLITADGWIVPGKPEDSRFFQVVTFPDEIPGAMPPTGHAISSRDVETLRAWIKNGATVPRGKMIRFAAKGELPRSS